MEKNNDEGEPCKRFFFFYALTLLLLAGCENKKEPVSALAGNAEILNTGKNIVALPVKSPVKKKKKIYLTFDDGPNKGTMNVLQIVKEENIPATFFLVGEHAFASPWQAHAWDSLKTATGIELCNHSHTHAHNRYSKFYTSPDSVIKDFQQSQHALGLNNNIVRAPGRNSWRMDTIQYTDIANSKATIDSLHNAGFQVMGWDLEWHYDAKSLQLKSSAEDLLRQIDHMLKKNKTKVPDNLVILAHDQVYQHPGDTAQLRTLIRQLKQHKEYELAFASNYPAATKSRRDTALKATPR